MENEQRATNPEPILGADLLSLSTDPSICLHRRDPSGSRGTKNEEYALRFDAALLHFADAPAYIFMLRGLIKTATCPTSNRKKAEIPLDFVSFNVADLLDFLASEAQKPDQTRHVNGLAHWVTWQFLWEYIEPDKIGVRLQTSAPKCNSPTRTSSERR